MKRGLLQILLMGLAVASNVDSALENIAVHSGEKLVRDVGYSQSCRILFVFGFLVPSINSCFHWERAGAQVVPGEWVFVQGLALSEANCVLGVVLSSGWFPGMD
mmetsp:Transcript_14163/g.41560  ORF Transcript_14163/g.41560 Transcript_14163/m.41560 type:complete len:104 (-) Transcript_14163:533-844(-)